MMTWILGIIVTEYVLFCGAVYGFIDASGYALRGDWNHFVWDMCWIASVLTMSKILDGVASLLLTKEESL